MKTKIINIEQSSDGDFTQVCLLTPLGKFYGEAKFNKEKDPLTPSKMMGGRIAEDRAYIAFYNELARDKRNELKGIKRLINSSNPNKSGYMHICNMYYVIRRELLEIYDIRNSYKRDILNAIDGRKIYLRSRTTDRKEKEEKLKSFGDAISALGQNTSKEQ